MRSSCHSNWSHIRWRSPAGEKSHCHPGFSVSGRCVKVFSVLCCHWLRTPRWLLAVLLLVWKKKKISICFRKWAEITIRLLPAAAICSSFKRPREIYRKSFSLRLQDKQSVWRHLPEHHENSLFYDILWITSISTPTPQEIEAQNSIQWFIRSFCF